MRTTGRIDSEQLDRAIGRLGEAAIDPSMWPEIMEALCRAVGASGAILLQSDIRTPDVPRTPSMDEATRLYFRDNYHLTDPRAVGFPRMISGEVITDHDVLTPEQIRSDQMYNDILRPFDFQWFAGVGFWAGSAFWALTIQRTAREGPFEGADKQLLSRLAPRLTETASLATSVGRAVLRSVTDAFQRLEQPALVLGNDGTVLATNAAADAGFDDEIRVSKRQLLVRDRSARVKLDQVIHMMRRMPDSTALPAVPIVVRRT
ncbi:hypothetical protein, partial [Bradyrhizobium sp.]|uniref:hypothetical protein n=1 Tax=Bradyrhizobium sp. TaxID=376 RepID=UPI0023960B14